MQTILMLQDTCTGQSIAGVGVLVITTTKKTALCHISTSYREILTLISMLSQPNRIRTMISAREYNAFSYAYMYNLYMLHARYTYTLIVYAYIP